MYNHEPKAYICPFCQIVRGETTHSGTTKSDVIFQNELVTAFIAGKWWKKNLGHVVVIPNEHVENIYDMPVKFGHAIFDASKQIAIALKEAYHCDATSTRQHNEPDGNQDVWHFHQHVFPRYKNDELYANHHDPYWASAEERLPYADKLRAYFTVKNSTK